MSPVSLFFAVCLPGGFGDGDGDGGFGDGDGGGGFGDGGGGFGDGGPPPLHAYLVVTSSSCTHSARTDTPINS